MKIFKYGPNFFKDIHSANKKEWIQGNGIGGFSSHTIAGGGNRIYHGYLTASLRAPVNRFLVLTRTQEKITTKNNTYDLTSQNYINWEKEGHKYIESFTYDGVPTYTYRVNDIVIKKTISMEYEKNTVAICYEIENGLDEINFDITPLFNQKQSGEYIAKNQLTFNMQLEKNYLTLKPTEEDFTIYFMASEGNFIDRRLFPMNFTTPNYEFEENHFYTYENNNGSTSVDNHYTPYDVSLTLKPYEKKKFYLKCSVDKLDNKTGFEIVDEYKERVKKLESLVDYKHDLANRLVVASDCFIVKRESTNLKTILAGYPWFNDWGRDTMIALTGLTLSTKRYDDAKEILESFSKYVKNGLVPNNFPDVDSEPGYNTVDGSLWYFYAVYKYLEHTKDYEFIKEKIYPILKDIINSYKTGTDFDIYMDNDYLIHSGNKDWQLTWMDVKIGDWVVTPRTGKAVEINALWYNALCVMNELSLKFDDYSKEYIEIAEKVSVSFNEKFWNDEKKSLYDVVDEYDDSIRPNQLYAVSLPFTMLSKEKEKDIVYTCYRHLYTPFGIRSLSIEDKRFVKEYIGKLADRDACYHMGTTWGFVMGTFITAYCKVHNNSKEATKKALEMFEIFESHIEDDCINGVSEIFDGEFSHEGRGCFTQAWSVSELLRVYEEDILPYL